eukprot:6406905-Prymnesium_polylepis.1
MTSSALRAGSGVRPSRTRDCCPGSRNDAGRPAHVDIKNRSTCREECHMLSAALDEIHRVGCEPDPPGCINAPGLTALPAAGEPHIKVGGGGDRHSGMMETIDNQPTASPPKPLPDWRRLTNNDAWLRLDRLRHLGYTNCTSQHDDSGDKCFRLKPAAEWMRWFWNAERLEKNSDRPSESSGESEGGALSWWRPPRALEAR